MVQEMRGVHHAREFYNRTLSSVYGTQRELKDPSLWRMRDEEIEDKVLRDHDIFHAVNHRCALVAGTGWNLTPRTDDDEERSQLAVDIGTELVEGIKKFTESQKLLARAFLPGQRFAYIHGGPRVLNLGDGKPRTWWVPYRLEDIDKRNMMIRPQKDPETGKLSAHWERWNVGTQQWDVMTRDAARFYINHTYADDQGTLGYGRGLLESLGWLWYAKIHVAQETLQATERYAQGTLLAKIDGLRPSNETKPNVNLLSETVDQLEDMRAAHVGAFDAADDVSVLEPSGTGWQMLQDQMNRLQNGVYTLILSANLTTSADAGGSYALAQVQENSTEALVQGDRKALEETLSDDLLGAIWYFNAPNLAELGILEQKPRFTIIQEKRQDPLQRAQVAQVLNQIGVDLSLQDLLDQTGFAKPQRDEPLIVGAAAAPEPGMGGLSLPGFPSLEPAAESLTPEPVAPAEPADIQETALNGAQVTAAAELVEKVTRGELPPGAVKRMLVSMFNLNPEEAGAMVDEAVAFQPSTPIQEPVTP